MFPGHYYVPSADINQPMSTVRRNARCREHVSAHLGDGVLTLAKEASRDAFDRLSGNSPQWLWPARADVVSHDTPSGSCGLASRGIRALGRKTIASAIGVTSQ